MDHRFGSSSDSSITSGHNSQIDIHIDSSSNNSKDKRQLHQRHQRQTRKSSAPSQQTRRCRILAAFMTATFFVVLSTLFFYRQDAFRQQFALPEENIPTRTTNHNHNHNHHLSTENNLTTKITPYARHELGSLIEATWSLQLPQSHVEQPQKSIATTIRNNNNYNSTRSIHTNRTKTDNDVSPIHHNTSMVFGVPMLTESSAIEPTAFAATTTNTHSATTQGNQEALLEQDLQQRCFPHNSKTWLEAGTSRLGNYNDDSRMDERFLRKMLLVPSSSSSSSSTTKQGRATLSLSDNSLVQDLLGQSLCLPHSRFVSVTEDDVRGEPSPGFNRNETIQSWASRLVYLAIHIHQHQYAIPEAQSRWNGAITTASTVTVPTTAELSVCEAQRQALKIGHYDYECPDAKFLVVSMGRFGLGAVMRLGAVNALIAGIATNRTVLILNHSPVGPKFVRQPWLLASCPRHDLQCFYMPTTPCVVTHDELRTAPTLSRGEMRLLFRHGTLPESLQEKRVLYMDIILRPQRMPITFRPNLHNIIQTHLVRPLLEAHPDDPRIELFQLAAAKLLEDPLAIQPGGNSSNPSSPKYYYFGHDSTPHHALVIYAMRPNLDSVEKLNQVMQLIVPKDLNPNLSLGLPIRASDKCLEESECLSFEQHMTLMGRIWISHQEEFISLLSSSSSSSSTTSSTWQPKFNASVIVTSESKSVLNEQSLYLSQELEQNLPFAVRFVNNEYDHAQGTGNPSRMELYMKIRQDENITLDDIMLSSISSLKVQFYARHTVGNCCSNFHLLLFDFLKDGCGAARHHVTECLQDNEDPEYRLCCQWSETEECAAKRKGNKTRTGFATEAAK